MNDIPYIDYDKIPYEEKRSTGEHVKKGAFYMSKCEEDDGQYDGYDAVDLFRLTLPKIEPLSDEEMEMVNW